MLAEREARLGGFRLSQWLDQFWCNQPILALLNHRKCAGRHNGFAKDKVSFVA